MEKEFGYILMPNPPLSSTFSAIESESEKYNFAIVVALSSLIVNVPMASHRSEAREGRATFRERALSSNTGGFTAQIPTATDQNASASIGSLRLLNAIMSIHAAAQYYLGV